MKLKKEISLLVKRLLVQSEVVGPFVELPLYLKDNGDYMNKNIITEKPDVYKNIDIINNYEIFELLCYMQKKGIIKEVKDILGYIEDNKEFDILTKMQFRKKNNKNTLYTKFTVLVTTSKYDMLEYLENINEEVLSNDF